MFATTYAQWQPKRAVWNSLDADNVSEFISYMHVTLFNILTLPPTHEPGELKLHFTADMTMCKAVCINYSQAEQTTDRLGTSVPASNAPWSSRFP